MARNKGKMARNKGKGSGQRAFLIISRLLPLVSISSSSLLLSGLSPREYSLTNKYYMHSELMSCSCSCSFKVLATVSWSIHKICSFFSYKNILGARVSVKYLNFRSSTKFSTSRSLGRKREITLSPFPSLLHAFKCFNKNVQTTGDRYHNTNILVDKSISSKPSIFSNFWVSKTLFCFAPFWFIPKVPGWKATFGKHWDRFSFN